MKNYKLIVVILTSIIIFSIKLAKAEEEFSDVYIFGDSLSDTGNLAAIPDFDFLNHPPYDRGFSNGPRAIEVLTQQMGLTAAPSLHLLGLNVGTNYAVSGARANGGEQAIELSSQIGAFLIGSGFSVPYDALYVIIIGSNDIRDARDVGSNAFNRNQIIAAAVESIDEAVRTLILGGAQSIMVVNSADIGATPETIALAQATGSQQLVRLTRSITQSFNQRLSQKLTKIKRDFNINLVEFDLFSFTQSLINNASALGYTNSTEACFSSVTFNFHPDCENGANFDQFVFFDEIHPTAKTNERTGRALFSLVPEFSMLNIPN